MNERAQHEKLTFESWWVLSWGYRQNNSPTKNQTCWTQECQCPDAWGFCVTHRPSFVRYHRDEIEEAFSFSPILRSFGVLIPRSLPDTIGELRDCGKVCMNIVHINYLQKFSCILFHINMPLWYLFFTAGHLDLGKVSCTSFFAHIFPGIPADFKSVGAVVLEFGSVVIR